MDERDTVRTNEFASNGRAKSVCTITSTVVRRTATTTGYTTRTCLCTEDRSPSTRAGNAAQERSEPSATNAAFPPSSHPSKHPSKHPAHSRADSMIEKTKQGNPLASRHTPLLATCRTIMSVPNQSAIRRTKKQRPDNQLGWAGFLSKLGYARHQHFHDVMIALTSACPPACVLV